MNRSSSEAALEHEQPEIPNLILKGLCMAAVQQSHEARVSQSLRRGPTGRLSVRPVGTSMGGKEPKYIGKHRGSIGVGRVLASAIILLTLGLAQRTWAGTPACDRALTYFRSSGGAIEWRVYDPASRRDALFQTVEGVPSEMTWDTSLTRVDFIVDRTLYRALWRAGSKRQIMCRFPAKPEACYWWFNPDSACWQFATSRVDLHIPSREYPSASACQSELWQSSRDGQRWHLVRNDTTVSDMDDCGLSEGLSSLIRREPKVTREEFAPPLSETSGEEDHKFPPNSAADSTVWEQLYVPLASVPEVGVEMFYRWGSTYWSVAGPAWLVNKSTGVRQVLCAAPSGAYNPDKHCSLRIREACGLLLVDYCFEASRVVDGRTGGDAWRLPKNASSIMVTPRLRR